MFIHRRSAAARFLLIPLQSEDGKQILQQAGITTIKDSSVVYIKDDRTFLRSSAILHILKDLGKGWQLFYYGLIIIPPFIRDPLYNIVARFRYRIWGKRKTCFLPPKE